MDPIVLPLPFHPSAPDSSEMGSKVVSLISISVMSVLFGIKTFNVQFKYLTYSRWLVLVLYFTSWGFTCAATLFVTTNNGNKLSCFLSEMSCDIFYSATKVIIYCWLIEKVWVVSSVRKSRWKTKAYQVHVGLLLPYSVIAALLIVFHIAEINTETLQCVIGIQPVASIPLLVYDFIFNLYFTVRFVRPLMQIGRGVQADWKQSRLHDVALRTLAASTVCLLISFANIFTLIILNGRERGVLCLTCCTVDVTINAVTIHWVTTSPSSKISKDHTNTVNNNDCTHDDPGTTTTFHAYEKPYTGRHQHLYDLPVDDYMNDGLTNTIDPTEHSKGYLGTKTQTGNDLSGMDENDRFHYTNGRFVMITGDQESTASEEEHRSQSSRRSLTKDHS